MSLKNFLLKLRQIRMVGVGGIIINNKGEVLLTKRIEKKIPNWNGKWGIPGGHSEFGEHPTDTLIREMTEELKVEIKVLDNKPLVVSRVINFFIFKCHGILLAYKCRIIKGTPTKTSKEHSALKWFNITKINFDKCIPSTEDFIKQL